MPESVSSAPRTSTAAPLRTVAIIQARMSSSRLPGKVLLDIAGQPMLLRVVERARRAQRLDQVVVATTTDPSDDPIVALCGGRGYPCMRGSQHDVLDRYYQAARLFQADIIVRLTADCPLIDPGLIDLTVNGLLGIFGDIVGVRYGELGAEKAKYSVSDPNSQLATLKSHPALRTQHFVPPFDFAADRLPPPWGRSYPIGLDVEVCTFAALERAWNEATQPYHREHVMPYLYEDERSVHFSSLQPVPHQPQVPAGFFRVMHLHHVPDYGALRWTVDTAEDLELVRQIYSRFPGRDDFSWVEVLEMFEREPELSRINADIRHKNYRDVDERRAV
jgi:spore coat polysaccharide biosynthesis protein SpsF